ncbi:hypothetical protein C8R44DRAFT_849563 [Mycena epipterygia]|nr:hypothetical protein C8R44DRAFT_849563 [Mycena epipterygia]
MAVIAANAILLVASWVNAGLYMLEIVLAVRYFQRAGRPLWQRLGVIAFLIADTANTIGICAQVYTIILIFPCVDSRGTFINALLWPVSVNILATYSTASVEQGFLCYLFYALTKRRFITGLLAFSIFVHLGFSWASAGLIISRKSTEGPAILTTLFGSVFCATTDILVAAALGATFYKMGASCYPGRSTQTTVRRLLVLSITSGVGVASITLLAMILLVVRSPVYILFFFVQGRAYALTILTHFLFGLPADPTPSENAGSRRTGTGGVVFHLDYRISSDATSYNNQTPRPESLNLQAIPDLHVKTQVD